MPARVFNNLDELKQFVGREAGVSGWLEVSQARINQFAGTTEDRQWIHIDAERAKRESPYGATIAHGFLTLSLLSELSNQAVSVRGEYHRRINYGLNRVRFPAPVPAGSRIRARFTLQALDEISGAIQITWAVIVEVEGTEKPALAAEWIVRLYR